MLTKVKEKKRVATAVTIILFSSLLVACNPPTYVPTPTHSSLVDISPDQSSLDATDPDGASGGRVNGLGSDSSGSSFYLASEWGGLFKSTDNGLTWSHLDGHLPTVAWDVAVDPSDSNRVYATSFYDGQVASSAGINVSNDGGTTWTHPPSATPPDGFCANPARRTEPSAFGISIDPDTPQKVYVGTNCGLAVSTDSGATWTYFDPTPGDPADNIWDVVVHDGGIIDLCGDDGHQRSTDGGTTWTTSIGAGLPSGRCSLAVSPDEPYVLFAVVGTTIRESDDGGATWPTILTNPRAQGRIPFVATNKRAGSSFDLWFGDVQLHRATCTTPSPANSGGAARCPTNTWVGPFTRGAGGHDDVGDILFDPNSTTDACPILFSSDGGVYYNTLTSTPGCQSPAWEQPTITPHALWLFAMAGRDVVGAEPEDLYFGVQDNGSFVTSDAGANNPTWTNQECCDSFDFIADATNVLYTVCCWGGGRANRLFLRGPGLAGGGPIGNNSYPPGNLPGWRAIDIIDQFGPNQYVVVTTQGVFFTNNVGANPIVWNALGAPPVGVCNVRATVAGGTATFFIQVGNCNEAFPNVPRAIWRFVGTNPAGIWQQVNPPGGTGGFGVYGVDAGNPNRIIAAHLQANANPAMVLTTDGGANWINLTALDTLMTGDGVFNYRNTRGPTNFTSVNGYPQPTLVAFDPQNTDLIVAGGADSGIFLSRDGGTNWTLVTDPTSPAESGKPHIPRPEFAYFDHEPTSLSEVLVNIYIGTKGRGVWRLTQQLPSVFELCMKDLEPCLPEFGEHLIELDCTGFELGKPCRFVDPLPHNCLVKWECPGCEVAELCPPFYHIFLDELDPRIWEVGLYTGQGDPVKFDSFEAERGVVISFRPDEELFSEGEIGDYLLAFRLKPSAELTHYSIQTHIEVGDEPYSP
jgi:hypothetical protein